MTIKFLNNGDTAEFFLEGRLDSVTSADAEKLLCETIEKNNFKTVIVDLEQIAYVSSAGLRIFYENVHGFEKERRRIGYEKSAR